MDPAIGSAMNVAGLSMPVGWPRTLVTITSGEMSLMCSSSEVLSSVMLRTSSMASISAAVATTRRVR